MEYKSNSVGNSSLLCVFFEQLFSTHEDLELHIKSYKWPKSFFCRGGTLQNVVILIEYKYNIKFKGLDLAIINFHQTSWLYFLLRPKKIGVFLVIQLCVAQWD